MPKIYGEIQEASLENLASDPSANTAGRIWHNTATGLVKVDNGTNKRALLRNDDKAVIGNNGTANNNIRLHRGASEVLQFVPGGDTTAEGTLATSLAQVSAQLENYTTAGQPAAGNAGRVIWNTTDSELRVDDGANIINALKLTTKGDIVTRSTVNVRLAVGTDGQVLKANSSTATGLQWGSGAANLAVRSVVATDTATNVDDSLILSGASFTETLFTAVGNTGKILEIVHAGTSISQVYTIDGNGAETIGGAATYIMRVNGQRVRIKSDGTNWNILNEDVPFIDAEIWVDTGNGHGSTNTKIRRYTNTRVNTEAPFITYADSAANGASATVNITGLYRAWLCDANSAAGSYVGFSVNGSALTTNVQSLTFAQGWRGQANVADAAAPTSFTQELFLTAGDIVRPHTNGTADTATAQSAFALRLLRVKPGV